MSYITDQHNLNTLVESSEELTQLLISSSLLKQKANLHPFASSGRLPLPFTMEETFDFLPLQINPSTKSISSTITSQAMQDELHALNATHRALLALDAPATVPPPPVPLNPKRSQQIQKMREQGNAALSKRNTSNPQASQQYFAEATKLYGFALQMALDRPAWEPAQIVREETSMLFSNRAQAAIALHHWPEASVDAETSIDMKAAPGQGKTWWRKVKSLMEMGRYDEAETYVERGIGIEPQGDGVAELKSLQVEIKQMLRIREQKKVGSGEKE